MVEVVAALEPTFGGINLEDFKAPECFDIEAQLKERMKIPVFHDDQHGTAIIVAAAVQNALHLTGKQIDDGQDRHLRRRRGRARLPQSAGRARRASARTSGSPTSRAWSTQGRPKLMDRWKDVYAQETDKRTLGRHHRRRRHLPRPLGRRRAQARDGQAHGSEAADHGARQSDARRSCPRRRSRRARTRMICTGRSDYPEPGQQRPVLSLHLPRRARCRRHHHQRGDEAGRGRGDRGARPRGALRGRGARLWRRGAHLRPRLADPEPVRSAADPAHRAGGRPGGDRIRRRDPSDRRFRAPTRSGSTASCSAPASS